MNLRTAIVLVALGVVAAGPAAAAQPHCAPSVALTTPEGREIGLPRRDGRVEIHYFWATWCPFCHEIKPYLNAIKEEFGDELSIFAINFRETGNDPAAYLAAGGYDFELLTDGEAAAEAYGAWVLPGVFVVDGAGGLRFNLYAHPMPDPPGYQALGSAEKARIRAPWWAARIREAVLAAVRSPAVGCALGPDS